MSPGTAVCQQRRAQTALCATVAGGVIFNNLLRWFPFPPERSANETNTLADNVVGIAVNLLLYGLLLSLAPLESGSLRMAGASRLVFLYSLFVLLQAPVRPDPLVELALSLMVVTALVSADRVAAVLSRDHLLFSRFMRLLWTTLVASLSVGLLAGIVKMDSVNWRLLKPSSAFAQCNRAQFFFRHIRLAVRLPKRLLRLAGFPFPEHSEFDAAAGRNRPGSSTTTMTAEHAVMRSSSGAAS